MLSQEDLRKWFATEFLTAEGVILLNKRCSPAYYLNVKIMHWMTVKVLYWILLVY